MEKKRLFYLDVLKTIAIIFMILIHTFNIIYELDSFGDNVNQDNLEIFINIIYWLGPTIFMLIMGGSINLTRKNTSKEFIKRGLNILLISLILNTIRAILICIICLVNGLEFTFNDYLETFISWVLGSDILTFAGLFFIIYGLILSITKDKKKQLIILVSTSLILYIISLIIPKTISFDNIVLSDFLSNFIYQNDTYFPIITWFIIPVIGYLYFYYFNKCEKKNKFMLITMLFSTLMLILLLVIINYQDRYLMWGERDFLFDLPTLTLTMLINFIYIPIIYFASNIIEKVKILNKVISFESRNLTKIYFTHWVLEMLLMLVLSLIDATISNLFIYVFIAMLILFSSSTIIYYINKKIVKTKEANH